MNYGEESTKKHFEWKGKFEIKSRVDVTNKANLALAYTPGVAQPCLEIEKNIDLSYELTRRGNLVAVITDGTAVLGLGDIGPEAGMPVMEGKCCLFKTYGNVDAIPLCIRSKDSDEIVRTVQLLCGSFGGINLEDISSPRCFEIERRLKETCDIPVFHDDQHGTAIVTGAALLNALKVVKKEISEIKVVINGAGAAGISIGNLMMKLGVKNIIMCDRFGIICEGMPNLNPAHEKISHYTNNAHLHGLLKDALVGADVFVGVSVGKVVTKDMISSMNKNAIVFPLANPVPEISRDEALESGAAIVGTGSSKFPNQINNVLVFPGIFRAALDTRASDINTEMMIAAVHGIADFVQDTQLCADYILPPVYDQNAHDSVARAVRKAAIETKVARVIFEEK